MKASAGSVVVTGSASGIGRATVQLLAKRGFRVFAAVRKPSDVEAWRDAAPEGVEAIELEVTVAHSIERAVARVGESLGQNPLTALVNNAGITVTCPLEFVDLDAMRWQFEVNVFGVAAVTRAFLPLLRRPGGRIVNISSGAGKIAPPLIGPYTASKHALEAMSDALRLELRGQGIAVAVLEPGFIESQMHEKNRRATRELLGALSAEANKKYGAAIERLRENDERQSATAAPASDVAEAVHRAISARRPRTRYPVTREAKLLAWIGCFLSDRTRDRIFGRMVGL
jgi:NAD(P)-dependent dehydrogenase (short-subunit alcohol dehydrogenase family)